MFGVDINQVSSISDFNTMWTIHIHSVYLFYMSGAQNAAPESPLSQLTLTHTHTNTFHILSFRS